MSREGRGTRTSRTYGIAVLAVLGLVLLAYVGRDGFQPVGPGARAPDFHAVDRAGQERGIDDYRGKVVLLQVWATWCSICEKEMPSMERLQAALDHPDFEIVAVSVDAPSGEADAMGNRGGSVWRWVEDRELDFTVLHDASGDIQRIYQTTGVPESFLIGRDGVIYRRLAGAAAWDSPRYRDFIGNLLEPAGERSDE